MLPCVGPPSQTSSGRFCARHKWARRAVHGDDLSKEMRQQLIMVWSVTLFHHSCTKVSQEEEELLHARLLMVCFNKKGKKRGCVKCVMLWLMFKLDFISLAVTCAYCPPLYQIVFHSEFKSSHFLCLFFTFLSYVLPEFNAEVGLDLFRA